MTRLPLALFLVAFALTATAAQNDDDLEVLAREIFEQLSAAPVDGPGHCAKLEGEVKKELDRITGQIDSIMAGHGAERPRECSSRFTYSSISSEWARAAGRLDDSEPISS